jgi:hypothetical protein
MMHSSLAWNSSSESLTEHVLNNVDSYKTMHVSPRP